MLKRKNKKGFTLAELLIVVAIIAVLIAIAVPLFVGALDRAEDRVIDANERSVKSIAAADILTNTNPASTYLTDGKLVGPWYAVATVSADGDVKMESISLTEPAEEGKKTSKKNDDGTFYIVVKIEMSDIKALNKTA